MTRHKTGSLAVDTYSDSVSFDQKKKAIQKFWYGWKIRDLTKLNI